MNKINLKLLADYLLNLPEDYTHFDMTDWHYEANLPAAVSTRNAHCLTAACAVGHAPYVQGLPKPFDEEGWRAYSERIFGMNWYSDEWEWCFDSAWEDVDNTPHGAAKRILWLLEHGLPDDLADQMQSYAPLCYTGEEK